MNVAYLIMNAIVALLMATAFLSLGSYLLLGPIRNTQNVEHRHYMVLMTLIISITFVIMFSIRSILVLYSAATRKSVPIIVFSLLEILPSLGIFRRSSSFLPTSTSSTSPTPRPAAFRSCSDLS